MIPPGPPRVGRGRSRTVEELRHALLAFRETDNTRWRVGRYGYKTPAQVRARLRAAMAKGHEFGEAGVQKTLGRYSLPEKESLISQLLDKIFTTKRYLLGCGIWFFFRFVIGMLSGYPFWRSIFGLALFTPLAIGVLCKLWLARKAMAAMHILYTVFGVYTLSALLYHGGVVDCLGYELSTLPVAVLSILINAYLFLGAIRLWRVR